MYIHTYIVTNIVYIYSDFSTAQECIWKSTTTELGSLKVWQVIAPIAVLLRINRRPFLQQTPCGNDTQQSEFPTGSRSYLLCSVAQKHIKISDLDLLFWFFPICGKKERVPKHHRFPLNISMVQSIRRPKVWKEESRQYRGGWTLGTMTFRADETLIVLRRWW